MAERAHLSIGEVLSLLQEDYPDVTISKIRFLESQGLLDPERTPSGYRKFYESDIERLRWILHQQRDNFLPLRVMKDRLEESARTGVPVEQIGVDRPERVEAVAHAARSEASVTFGDAERERGRAPAAKTVPRPPAPAPGEPGRVSAGAVQTERHALDTGPSGVSLTRDELASATGLHDRTISDLERYGLLAGRPMGRETIYDEEALIVARLAARFVSFGVEARHLRMYKIAAEREAGVFEQLILPLLKQRNPAARQRAFASLNELAGLGDELRAAMLRHALREYL